jgi:phosphomannomutase
VSARWTDHEGREQEARDALASRLAEIHAAITTDFHQGRGFGALVQIDYLDGLRMSFAGGDVAHVRPSGNAPQLRIYALASTDERARAIVDMALAPGGLFSAMLARL